MLVISIFSFLAHLFVTAIHDVVCPLPGSGIQYPNNDLKAEYSKLLECDGIPMNVWDTIQKDFYCHGAYRRLLQRPRNLQWRAQKYADSNQQFVLTDMDVIAGKALAPVIGTEKKNVITTSCTPSLSFANNRGS